MKHLGLFEGIGGFALAVKMMGWETLAWVEINEFCQKILKKNFKEAKGYGDIRKFDGTKWKGKIDIITGGFPCQPFSIAGNQKGKKDKRFLWYEMLRVIREVQPVAVIGENVTGILSMDNGAIFEEICTSLESENYQVQSFIIPACSTGAPHKRNRVWIIAYSNEARKEPLWQRETNSYKKRNSKDIEPEWNNEQYGIGCNFENDSNNNSSWELQQERIKQNKWGWYNNAFEKKWYEVATELCGVDDGIPQRLDKYKRKRLEALGNAVVPQVAFQILQSI